jgi:hypothetical protein
MKKTDDADRDPADLDGLIAGITGHAISEDEQSQAFLRAVTDGIPVPCDGFVIGEPVSVVAFEYNGNARRGLTAKCRRRDGSEHVVSVADVFLPPGTNGTRCLAAYRKWMGLEPFPHDSSPALRKRQHKVETSDIEPGGPVELVVLSVKETAARCRLLRTDRVITLRFSGLPEVVPGEIAVVKPRKQWSYAGHPYLSGMIESSRLDVEALGLVPLKLEDQGTWNPKEHYWGEKGEPIEEWVKPIISRGPRQQFEMEQILPGNDPEDFDNDPILESNDLKDSGDFKAADKILMELCHADLRCLDAHAHLGNLVFDHGPKDAIRHYEVGLRIGELSLGPDFDGLLPWGCIDNRPFLRCMQGYGLCLWRLDRFEEAGSIFNRMLWLNPTDNQGVRFLVDEIRSRTAWQDSRVR